MSFQSDVDIYVEAKIKERVLKGIELLDRKYGPEWVNRVDVMTLDLSCVNFCVLGQVYDGYVLKDDEWDDFFRIIEEKRGQLLSPFEIEGYRKLNSVARDGYTLGIIALDEDVYFSPEDYGFEAGGEEYTDLDEVWKEEIELRQAS